MRLEEKDEIIAALNTRVESLAGQLVEAETEAKSKHENLAIAQDDTEQYGRRMNIRIENIEYKMDETEEELKEKIEEVLTKVGVDVEESMLVRWHRSGRAHVNDDGIRVAQTILKFRSWKPRKQAHAWRKYAKELDLPFIIRPDLTKRRYNLLREAIHAAKSRT